MARRRQIVAAELGEAKLHKSVGIVSFQRQRAPEKIGGLVEMLRLPGLDAGCVELVDSLRQRRAGSGGDRQDQTCG